MTLHVSLPDSLAAQARALAGRAARVAWQKVDAILARVPAVPPMAGDERLKQSQPPITNVAVS